MAKRKKRSHEELAQLARDIVTGKVFLSTQITRGQDLTWAFPILSLMNKKQLAELKAERTYAIYEYLDRRLSWTVNGFPAFLSFYQLTKEEWDKVRELCKLIDTAMKSVLEKP